ncbi:hypothetical protein RQP46_007415 [Phenoliferia psychrophenolica]
MLGVADPEVETRILAPRSADGAVTTTTTSPQVAFPQSTKNHGAVSIGPSPPVVATTSVVVQAEPIARTVGDIQRDDALAFSNSALPIPHAALPPLKPPHTVRQVAPEPIGPSPPTPLEAERLDRINEKRDQARAIKETPNDVLERQLERVKVAKEVEEKGEAEVGGTLVPGLSDSVLWTYRRRFDVILLILHPPSRLRFFPNAIPAPKIPVPAQTSTAESSFLLSVPDPAFYKDKLQLVEDYAKEGGKIFQRLVLRVSSGGYTATEEGNGVVGRKRGTDEERQRERQEEGGRKPIDGASNDAEGQTAAETVKELEKGKEEWGDEQRDEVASQIAKSLQDLLGKTADAIEILQNALSPPTPFPANHSAKKNMVAVLAPGVVIIPLVPAWVWSYLCGAVVGFAFFGQPLIIRGAEEFVARVPDWRKKLHLRDSIFSGVPTNMQLTLHILRVKEAAFHPLPPPPDLPTDLDVKEELDSLNAGGNISDSEAGILVDDDESVDLDEPGGDSDGGGPKKTKGVKSAFKRAAQRVIGDGSTLGQTRQKVCSTFHCRDSADAVAQVGAKVDKELFHAKAHDDGSNYSFSCKLGDASGHFRLDVRPGVPATVAFYPIKSSPSSEITSFKIADLVEIKKLGVSAKRAALSAAANLNLEGKGLSMRFKSAEERRMDGYGKTPDRYTEDFEGSILTISQVHRRDELVARLVAIPASMRWESL